MEQTHTFCSQQWFAGPPHCKGKKPERNMEPPEKKYWMVRNDPAGAVRTGRIVQRNGLRGWTYRLSVLSKLFIVITTYIIPPPSTIPIKSKKYGFVPNIQRFVLQ